MNRVPPPRQPRPDHGAAPLAGIARVARRRAQGAREDPVTPVGLRLAQVGVLGWTIVVPVLLGVLIGHGLDRLFGTGVLFAAALVACGAALGLWLAWRWMHNEGGRGE